MVEGVAREKLNQRTKAQLIDMVMQAGNPDPEGRVAQLEADLEDAQNTIREQEAIIAASAMEVLKSSAEGAKLGGAPEKRFTQISAGLPYGAGLTLFALDEDGQIWQTVIGREPWTLLPRTGLPGFPS